MRVLIFMISVVSALLTTACASRTLYAPYDEKSGGYSESVVQDDFQIAEFSGNHLTHPKHAKLFSNFRAVEICLEKGFKFANLIDLEDRTRLQTIQRISIHSHQSPSHFQGTTGTHGSKSSVRGTVFGGSSHSVASTWNETYRFPKYDTYFYCGNATYTPGIILREIDAGDIKEYTKDKLGGVQVLKPLDSPNKNVFEIGDIILKVNGLRVLDKIAFLKSIDTAPDKERISALIVREGINKTIYFKATDNTAAFIELNKKIASRACAFKEISGRPLCVHVSGRN